MFVAKIPVSSVAGVSAGFFDSPQGQRVLRRCYVLENQA